MVIMTVLLVLSLIVLGAQLMVLVINLLSFPELDAVRLVPAATLPTASILVPARNEALTLPQTLPALLAQGAHEVIVLNDQSEDATASVLAAFAQHPRLRIMNGQTLPEGWTGKNWACHQLANAATGQILIFTDADVHWQADCLNALLSFQQHHQADLVSVWPQQRTLSLSERLTVPLIDVLLLSYLPYPAVTRLPHPALSAGNGQLMLWRNNAYWQLNGHEVLKHEVLEDVRLAQHAKQHGLRIALAVGRRRIATRMYTNHKDVMNGFSKNILAASNNSSVLLVGMVLGLSLVYSGSWVLAFWDARWLVVGVLGVLQRALVSYKTARPLWEALLQPFAFLPVMMISFRALRRAGAYDWKGRKYERS